MASYQRERERFVANFIMGVLGRGSDQLHLNEAAAKFLRYASTLHRLAEAQCNGDYPYEHGASAAPRGGYRTCVQCEGQWFPSAVNKAGICVDCRTATKVKALAAEYGYTAYVQGDPRGYVLRLYPAGTTADDMHCGRGNALGVPTR
jgi:hypothetical protein